MSNNPPFRTINLTEEQFNFLKRNCDANIMFGISAIQNEDISRNLAETLIEQMENFKAIKKLLDNSR